MYDEDCSICLEIRRIPNVITGSKYGQLISSGVNVLFEDDNFLVLPSIGAINESHVLLVPTSHFASIGSMPNRFHKDLEKVKSAVRTLNRLRKNRDIMFFEHGTGLHYDCSGSCISHAHLHAIWFEPEVFRELNSYAEFRSLCPPNNLYSAADTANGYLFCELPNGSSWLANSPNVPPQLFRRLYSRVGGKVLVWNWRSDRRIEVVHKAIDYYHGLRDLVVDQPL